MVPFNRVKYSSPFGGIDPWGRGIPGGPDDDTCSVSGEYACYAFCSQAGKYRLRVERLASLRVILMMARVV